MASTTYDFIVVGGGPAGSAVAAGLAKAGKKPSVLLVEAGPDNSDRNLRVDGQRWTTFMNPSMNWGYKTSPQEHCNARECDYSRGKGLGGSSAINFGVYSVGARDDYDEWARKVGDDFYSWPRMQSRFKALETFNGKLPPGVDAKYASPDPKNHGTKGPLKVGYAAEWESDLPAMIDVFEGAGWPLNPDHNSGNPMGMSVLINSAQDGLRSTANDLITPVPQNLTVVTGQPVARVLFADGSSDGKKCIGVETADGTKYTASKEVVLSAGSLDDPKILMHSGIGPKAQLEQFGLPVVRDSPSVGQGMRDHMFCPLVYKRSDGSTTRDEFYGKPQAMEAALEQWKRDGTGPWAKYACEMGIGWAKIPGLEETDEYRQLPADERAYLAAETVPHYEVLTHFPIHWFIPGFPDDAMNYSCLLVFYFNAQAKGEVTLQSADPSVPLKFDPKFLSHPFDRRVAIESLRSTLKLAQADAYARDSTATLAAPASDSDDDLLEYWRNTIGSSWHMTGTLKMGKKGEEGAVVDPDFRLQGTEGLRVADMSVVPVLASCHIQAVAYVTGVSCAEKLVAEYGLA